MGGAGVCDPSQVETGRVCIRSTNGAALIQLSTKLWQPQMAHTDGKSKWHTRTGTIYGTHTDGTHADGTHRRHT